MKGPDISLRHLQRALTMELTTVNTYIYQERQLNDWGIDRLAARLREEIAEEREHAERFLTRYLFLGGEDADVRTLDPIERPETVRQLFEVQHRMEKEAIAYYNEAAVACQQAGDVGSYRLFSKILRDEEEHLDFLEDQFSLMEMVGPQLYIARQVSPLADPDGDGH